MNSLFSAGTRSRWSARSHRPAPAVAILAALAACVLGACQAAPAAPAPTSGSAAKPATAATTAPTAASGTTAAAKPAAATPATAAPPFVVARDVQLLNGDPHREYSDDALLLLPMLYEQLVRVDPKDISKFIPDAADRWTVSDDATSYTFTLHAGMKFGSGNPVAAEDVKFSLERLKNLKGPPSFLMDGVKEVAAVDAATVRITLEAPDAAFLSKLASGYAGVVDSKLARDNGALSDATAKDADKAAEFFGGRSAGGGPFILESWTRGQELRMRANPNYFKGPAKLDTILIRDIKDVTTQRQLIERGDVDMATNIDVDTAKELKSNPAIVLNTEAPSIALLYLGLTTNPAISKELSEQKVRQAMAAAIDYDGLVSIFGGAAVQMPSIVLPGYLGAEGVPPVKRDLARARQLLSEAGYAGGFSVTLSYPNGVYYGVNKDIVVQKLQSDLKEIGITVALQPMEFPVYAQQSRAGQLAFLLGPWTIDYMDTDALIEPFGTPNGVVAKRVYYQNAENGKLQADALRTTDPARRTELYKQVQQNMQADASMLGLLKVNGIVAYRNTLTGYEPNPPAQIDFYTIARK